MGRGRGRGGPGNRGKWRMCQFFMEGFCKYADDCNFLHDPYENDYQHFDDYDYDYEEDYKQERKRRKKSNDDEEMEFHPPSGYEKEKRVIPAYELPAAASNKLSFVPNIDYYIPMIN